MDKCVINSVLKILVFANFTLHNDVSKLSNFCDQISE